MGQEPMQNTQKPHTQYIAASRENKAPVQKTSRALATWSEGSQEGKT